MADFGEVAAEWLTLKSEHFVKYNYFSTFFKKVNDNNFEDFRGDFLEMCTQLHALSTNHLALALAQGQNSQNHTDAEYIDKLQHLINLDIAIEKRIDAALNETSKFKIKYFGQASIAELVTYNEPSEFTFLNQKSFQAIQIFDADKDIKNYIKGNKTKGKYFNAFNIFIKENILEEYTNAVYGKSSNDLTQEDLYSKTGLMLEIHQFFNWLFEAKKDTTIYNNDNVAGTIGDLKQEVANCFIDEIVIENFYSIKNLKIENLKNERFIFLLGENGSGKTIFLKALLTALKKAFIDDEADRRTIGIIAQILKDNPNFELYAKGLNDDIKEVEFNIQKEPQYLKNAYAYGTKRNKISETQSGEPYGFMTLFSDSAYNDDFYLRNIEQWLQEVKLQELENVAKFKIKDVAEILRQFLELDNFEIEIIPQPRRILFKIDNQPYNLKQLSEGYQSVLLLIIDLLSRLIENNPTVKHTKDFYAVVLIDELDLFLHPKWEKNICHKLYNLFPNIQFFITTHSPILIDGATKAYNKNKGSKDKNIDISEKITLIRLKNKNGNTVKEREYRGEYIKNWTPNLLLNSVAFDVDYWDDMPQDVAVNMRTEQSEAELSKLLDNISAIREEKSMEMKAHFFEILKNNKYDFDKK